MLPSRRLAEGWTTGAAARKLHGEICSPLSEHAKAWDILGAGWAEGFDRPGEDEEAHLGRASVEWESVLADLIGQPSNWNATTTVAEWNDAPQRTQDHAIALAREAEKVLGLVA